MSRDGFLDRWSRRKLEQSTEQPVEEDVAAKVAPPAEDPRTDDQILEDLGLPHPEELSPGDDIKGFLNPVVPDRLRRLALRQLWRSNPVLANVDGLVEYGEDYTDAAMVVENLQTLYQVGKGMWHDAQDQAGEADATTEKDGPEAEQSETATTAGGPDAPAEIAPENEIVSETTIVEAPKSVDSSSEPDVVEDAVGPTRRRMGFTFADS